MLLFLGVRRGIKFLSSVNVRRSIQLTPRAKTMYNLAKKLKKTVAELDRENVVNRERLQLALECAESGELFKNRINKTTYRFLQSQIRLQKKSARGRRFDIDDKIFALSILKQSPKGYRFLQKMFALPSSSTLMKLLRKIPLNCGINQAIFDSLKKSVEKMSTLDKCCLVMFDEISVESALSYSYKDDQIVGFEDYADGNDRSMQITLRYLWLEEYLKNGSNL